MFMAFSRNCRCFKEYTGKIVFHTIQHYSTSEMDTFMKTVIKFVHEVVIPNSSRYDKTEEYPWETVKKAHALGLMNTEISESLGGLGLSLKAKIRIFEEIAYGDLAVGTTLMVNELAQTPIYLSGSDYLKENYLKQMLGRPIVASYAITEENAGSDVANIKTTATLDGDNYIINGAKTWITNAGVASWYFVLARTNIDSKCPTKSAFTGFIVDRELEGVVLGKKEQTMGQRCSDTRALVLNNVKIPSKNIVGKIGEGFLLAMRAFDRVRPVVASMSCGLMQRSLDEATAYAQQRITFNRKIIDNQGISFKLANMALALEAARELTNKSAQMIDEGHEDSTYYSSCAKVFASENAFQVAADAVQIFGGNGLSSEYPVEKLLRDSKVLQVYGGTNEIQRVIIARKLTRCR